MQKQLLIAESELNREQMVGEIQRLGAGIRALKAQAGSLGSMASSATTLASVLSAFQHGKPLDLGSRPGWIQTLLKSLSLGSTLWLAFRPRNRVKKQTNGK